MRSAIKSPGATATLVELEQNTLVFSNDVEEQAIAVSAPLTFNV
jgi:hypothetical protein